MCYRQDNSESLKVSRLLRRTTSLFVTLPLLCTTLLAADGSRISGTVSSKGTNNALQGATVRIPSLGRTVLTDSSGTFSLIELPAGPVQVVVSYSGFQDTTTTVTVGENGVAQLDVVLVPADVVAMEKFTVETMKEGAALSVTEQRNATNIKTVVALDEWGVLPTQNIGELASRLPGITYTTDEDDVAFNVSIRGQPDSYTRLNIDGMSSTGVSGVGRTATLHSFSAANYEQIEIINAQTPDKRADSLGGQLNLKTRSPLAMKEKRRITYGAASRYYPSFADRTTMLADHPLHGDANIGYTEVFDVFGGKRNLGLAFNASYQEVGSAIDYDFLQYQNTLTQNAYFHDYDKRSGYNLRKIAAFMGRADYQIADHTRASLSFIYNAGYEPSYDRTRINPFAPRTIYDATATPNGAILPGYSPTYTEVRAVSGTRFDVETWDISFVSKNPTGTLRFDHDFGRLKIDHAYRWSNTVWWSGDGLNNQGGQYTSRLNAPLGFILNNSDLDGRVFTQTAGPSIYSVSSYTPILVTNSNTTTQPVQQTSRSFVKRDSVTKTNEVSAFVNATYQLPVTMPITLKSGLDTVNRRVNSYANSPRRWYGVLGSTLNTDLMPISDFEIQHGGSRVAAFSPAAVNKTLGDTSLWYEDVNYNATQPYTGRRILEEGVDSAYIMATVQPIKRLTIVGGIRHEWVSTDLFTYFRATSTAIATQPDHYKRAAMDFRRSGRDGSYDKGFPSVHGVYDITSNLKLRGGWSMSYGRPLLAQLLPGVTPDTTTNPNQPRLTIGNPSLKPQVAENTDLKLEYYFKNNGLVSAGVFRKRIKDYISPTAGGDGTIIGSGADNGFDGEYAGYEIYQTSNIGDAKAEGIELDFRQRLAFLPGAFKGLTVSANYTYQRTEGRFETAVARTTSQVPNFVPRLANARLQYTYKKFGASFDAQFKGKYLVIYSTTGGANRFQDDLWRYNAGVTYRVRPNTTVFLNALNLTEAGPEQFFEYEGRTSQRLKAATSLQVGVTGQF